jgi:hypothetical protein
MITVTVTFKGSLVVKTLGYKPEGRGFRDPMRWNFKIYLILPAALGTGVYSASNRNQYRKQTKKMFLGSKVRLVRGADNLNRHL